MTLAGSPVLMIDRSAWRCTVTTTEALLLLVSGSGVSFSKTSAELVNVPVASGLIKTLTNAITGCEPVVGW
jgi:hypothetical protein